ncbi:MAG: hypothetical protein H5T64_09045 [Chloroflexi bacterium]|nr:hypothetical protein [Chloroflexota bacterium]
MPAFVSRRWQATILLVVLGCLILVSTLNALAEGPIQVIESSVSSTFSEKVVFHLEARSVADITAVTLYYQIEKPLRIRVDLDFPPATRISLDHTWSLKRGQLSPGTELEYWWAIADAAGNTLVTRRQKYLYRDERFDWRSISEGNLVLYYYSGREAEARHLLDVAREALDRIQESMGVILEQPVKIWVYANQRDMSAALASRGEVYDESVLTLGVAAEKDTLLLLGAHEEINETIAHELSHIVAGLAVQNPYTDLPRWLDEGLAMYAEGPLSADRRAAVERAIRNDTLISVRSLSAYSGDPSQVDLFYGEVYMLVDFMLRTYGKEKMAQLIETIKTGKYTPEEALVQVYGFDYNELDARWRAELGLSPRSQTPQPISTASPTETPPPRPSVCPFSLAIPLSLVGAWWFRKRSDARTS